MNLNFLVLKTWILTLFTASIILTAHATPDYPTIDDELGRLLVTEMGALMNDYPQMSDPNHPVFTDDDYRSRFLEMSGTIQYRLTTDVKNHIKHRTERYRSATERTLGLTEMYFPIFEEYLAEKNIPYHLKYLPIVESNLNPVAKSHAAAVGLWQFIPGTGRLYGLKIASYLDERSDTHKASHAAATMLSNLYKRYGDWPLALAAYNCGPGRVDKYVKGTNKNFWDIRKYLPKETQMYVPYFMAVAYTYEYYHLHELKPKKLPADLVLTDSIHLGPGYKSLSQLSQEYNLSKDTLKRLNPAYIKNYIPSSSKKSIIVLPARIVAKLRNYETAYKRLRTIQKENPIKCIRRVNTEADLQTLMKAHRFRRQDLLYWNNLPDNYRVRPGDVVAVRQYYVPKDARPKKEVRKNIEGISIASLKVVGLDDKQEKAVTAPVYVSLKKKKMADKLAASSVMPTTQKANSNMGIVAKRNPYQLKNTTTAVTAQRAQKDAIITEVSTNRTRGRRLRTTVKSNTAPTMAPTTALAPANYNKPQMLAVKPMPAPNKAALEAEAAAKRAEEARKKAEQEAREAKEAAQRKAAAAQRAREEEAAKKVTAAKQVSQLSKGIQAKEQAVIKAKKYAKTSGEEVAALSYLHEQTAKLKKERLNAAKTTPKAPATAAKKAYTNVVRSTTNKKIEQTYDFHTVAANETIWDIAKKYANVSAQELMEINNITSTTILRTGMVLKIRKK